MAERHGSITEPGDSGAVDWALTHCSIWNTFDCLWLIPSQRCDGTFFRGGWGEEKELINALLTVTWSQLDLGSYMMCSKGCEVRFLTWSTTDWEALRMDCDLSLILFKIQTFKIRTDCSKSEQTYSSNAPQTGSLQSCLFASSLGVLADTSYRTDVFVSQCLAVPVRVVCPFETGGASRSRRLHRWGFWRNPDLFRRTTMESVHTAIAVVCLTAIVQLYFLKQTLTPSPQSVKYSHVGTSASRFSPRWGCL
jgi:hypothetical protein